MISGEDFSLSKRQAVSVKLSGENASSTDQKCDGDQRSTRTPDQETQQTQV
jgi:hypothetical protein